MNIENNRFGWGFWLQWVLASILGITISQVIAEAFTLSYESFIIAGFSVGFLQWRVLRSRLPKSGWWILVTTIGFGFGFAISSWPPDLTILQYVLAWAIAGLIQWFYLRGKVFQAGWWIPTTTLALSIAVIANYGFQWKLPYEIVYNLGFEGIRRIGNSFEIITNSPAGQAHLLVKKGIQLGQWYLAEAFMGIVLTIQLRYSSKKQLMGYQDGGVRNG